MSKLRHATRRLCVWPPRNFRQQFLAMHIQAQLPSRGLHRPDDPETHRSTHLVPEHLKHVELLSLGLCKARSLQR